jgi:hypothetical protein
MTNVIGLPRDVQIVQGEGIRGRLTAFIRRVIRKLIRWYVYRMVVDVIVEVQASQLDQDRSIVFLRQELELANKEISRLHLRLTQLDAKVGQSVQ